MLATGQTRVSDNFEGRLLHRRVEDVLRAICLQRAVASVEVPYSEVYIIHNHLQEV